ncbi:MAG: 50S ribosomal protein L10 [Desulfobaccales bacterium]
MVRQVIKEKDKIVQEIREKVSRSQIGILSDFKGLKVEEMTGLRRQLQEAGAELQVVKNTLLRRAAAADSPIALLVPKISGPNALTLGFTDPVALAKIMIKFSQDKPLLQIKGAVLSGEFLSPKDLETLSKLPAREVLLAQLLGVLQGVPTGLVTVLAGVIRSLLNVLVAHRDQQAKAEVAAGGNVVAEEAAGGDVEAEGAAGAEAKEVEAEGVTGAEVEAESAAGAEVEEVEAAGDTAGSESAEGGAGGSEV